MGVGRLYGTPAVFYPDDNDEICWTCGRNYSSPRLKGGKYHCPMCGHVIIRYCQYCGRKIEMGPNVENCIDGCGAPLTDDYLEKLGEN